MSETMIIIMTIAFITICIVLVLVIFFRSVGSSYQQSAWFIKTFFTRDSICYSAYMLSPFRLSVRLSDGCIIEKRLKLGL